MTIEEKEDVIYRIENEGIDYTFNGYSTFLEIEDEKFHKLRKNYIKSCDEMNEHLKRDNK